jgi:outer membrane protein
MNKRFFFLFLAVLFCGSTVFAAAKKAEKLTKVGCIDIQQVLTNLSQKDEVTKKLTDRQKELDKKKADMERELATMLQNFTNDRGRMKPNEIADNNIKIYNKKQDLAVFIDKSNYELQDLQEALLQPLLKKVREIIKDISVSKGFSMIIDKAAYVYYVDKELDITGDVIDELHKQHKEDQRENGRD